MAIYDLRCSSGHRFEVIQPFSADLPPCPSCGAASTKLPARFGMGGAGLAGLPPSAERMPQTWRGTYNGNREYVTSLQRTAEARQRLEDKHPELAGDRRPIVAHEGRYEQAPLRWGDPGPTATEHPHPHPHPHPH